MSPRGPAGVTETDELRRLVGAVDPDVLAAADDVDVGLIEVALARRPLERVEFAQQMLETLLAFRHVGAPRL
jgi:hypothetical protein